MWVGGCVCGWVGWVYVCVGDVWVRGMGVCMCSVWGGVRGWVWMCVRAHVLVCVCGGGGGGGGGCLCLCLCLCVFANIQEVFLAIPGLDFVGYSLVEAAARCYEGKQIALLF